MLWNIACTNGYNSDGLDNAGVPDKNIVRFACCSIFAVSSLRFVVGVFRK